MGDASTRPVAASPAQRPLLSLGRVALTNFRSYARAELEVMPEPVVLTGANGTGKTNLLEAISLLSPGRGLRGAKLNMIQRRAPVVPSSSLDDPFAESLWAVSASLTRPEGVWDIGTGLTQTQGAASRRALHLNGAPASSPDVVELLPMLWLTPAMDRLFLEGAGERRRFLDRLVFALDSMHARRAARYERAMQERMRLLRDGMRDPSWLDGLEETMAQEGSAITEARLATIETLNVELAARGAEGAFPCAHLALADASGGVATDEARLKDALRASRDNDAEAGRTLVGPHLNDLEVRHTVKRADARDCSTGEQKALLVSIVLANAWVQGKRRGGVAPILLLDEIAAHLDSQRRAALIEELLALKSQAWLTGTDRNLFAALDRRAQFFSISGGQFVRVD
jgi:DNA replication and repair protein RecF